jgi:antirestriction protein ArdC
MTQHELRRSITQQIVDALEKNIVPWRKPWTASPNAGRPANFVSKKSYSGVNVHLLALHQLRHGFTSRWYGTFQQWKALGCSVMKRPERVPPGQWGCSIVFAKPLVKTTVDKDTGDEVDSTFFLLRNYCVFNADQVSGAAAEAYKVEADDHEGNTIPDFMPADELVAKSGADVRFQVSDRAFYRRPTPEASWPNHSEGDFVVMPLRSQFHSQVDLYATLLHELSHWSEIRVGYDHAKHGYAMTELVAEMSGCFLCQELRVPQSDDLENHVAYLRSWLDSMKGDPSFIFRASTFASRITDYLLSFVQQAPQPVATQSEEGV